MRAVILLIPVPGLFIIESISHNILIIVNRAL